jgi:hypothetical protein
VWPARQGFQAFGIDRGRQRAKFVRVANEHFVTEKFMEGGIAWIQLQN